MATKDLFDTTKDLGDTTKVGYDPGMLRPNRPIQDNQPYQPSPYCSIHIMCLQKIQFQQRIAMLFGAERLREILDSPEPFILPFLRMMLAMIELMLHLFRAMLDLLRDNGNRYREDRQSNDGNEENNEEMERNVPIAVL